MRARAPPSHCLARPALRVGRGVSHERTDRCLRSVRRAQGRPPLEALFQPISVPQAVHQGVSCPLASIRAPPGGRRPLVGAAAPAPSSIVDRRTAGGSAERGGCRSHAGAGRAARRDPGRSGSFAPNSAPAAAHATEVEPDSFAWGSTVVTAFQTGRVFNGGASDIGWATSTNGGVSWTHGFLPGTTAASTPTGPFFSASDASRRLRRTRRSVDHLLAGRALLRRRHR